MLGFIAQFVGRLPVGRKLLLIYLLDLTAVLYVSGILIYEKRTAIAFTAKEVSGNLYIASVRDVLVRLPLVLPGAVDAGPPQAQQTDSIKSFAQAGLATLTEAHRAHGEGMKAEQPLSAMLAALNSLVEVGPQAALQPAQRALVLKTGRELITRIGNQSNLILDPDLDSYYTMSLVLLRFPEVLDLLAQLSVKTVEAGLAPPIMRNRVNTELLIIEGRLDAAILGIESDYAEALAAGPPALQEQLEPQRQSLVAKLQAFRAEAAGLSQLADAARTQAVNAQYQGALAQLEGSWKAAEASLGQLLQARVRNMYDRMWLHLGTAAALLGVILSLVYFVASQIAGPIRRLAGVATDVSRSGDYSRRAQHDSPDEIGQLVVAFNGMLADLDRSRAMREDLAATNRAQEAQRVLLESFPSPLIVTSVPEHRVLHANQPAQTWLQGIEEDPWKTCLDAPVRARYFQMLSDIGQVDSFEVQWRQGSSEPRMRWALLSGRMLHYQGQQAVLTVFAPIGQIKRLEQRLQLWAKVFEASSESIIILDVERRILTANRAFMRSGGWQNEDVLGQQPDFFYSPNHGAEFYETLWQSTIIRGSWQGEVWLKRKDGQSFPTWLVASVVRNQEGHLTNLVASAVDMSEHKSREERIHHLAHHDVLTDLPNRSLCMERLRMAIEQANRKGELVGVVFIDLARFKNINDSMGHHTGDALLRSVSLRLQEAVRAGDTVSRLGGDEFVVVLNGASSREELLQVVAARIVPLIREPHVLDGISLHVSCSAGIAVFPQDGQDVDHLMRNADAAMYQAKAAGRNMAVFFRPEFLERAQERLDIENALRNAVDRQELSLHYQPRIDARNGDVVGVEALVRWQHPELGLVLPGRFIRIAEETGQIVAMGRWILREACKQHAQWLQEGVGQLPISVNVSAVQLKDASLSALLTGLLSAYQIEPACIELELTESFLMDNTNATVNTLERLKATGVSLAIDDFGTGYSSLNYLHQFPIDKLKIDQSFVRDVVDDPADLAITKAIAGLGHTLGLRVVAEGVETEAEAALLREAGCDELQGFLFAHPMPAAELQTWLGGRRLAAPDAFAPRPRALPKRT
jgi:diguanylate cyclase (GGDEF)-like protein/PAS domain S-box-containing protein